ncbi:DUF397 domain-containing protein [Streptomyces sp. NBC_01142]|uniref:DUF397 domain-containing protein n=1 Tax=Streptomyces sp. NBC_01142 TaxID=2975865 RepID=UPI00225C2F29|nr:DUF397 domain-containing protein [Streptomyces sp. NBC_01142]MCX4823799.1 DUF397 domain-containing protein [Streptomyces sp. NBC_01142]
MNTEQLHWFKSSHSGGEGGSCIEVAASPATIHIRDSKVTQGPQLAVTPTTWSAFVTYTGLLPLD